MTTRNKRYKDDDEELLVEETPENYGEGSSAVKEIT